METNGFDTETNASALAPAKAPGQQRSEIRKPDGRKIVDGFPVEVTFWKANDTSRNSGSIYIGLNRVDNRGNRLRTFRLQGGDLVGVLLGIAEVFAHFSGDTSLPEFDRRAFADLASRVSSAVVGSIDPRSFTKAPAKKELAQANIDAALSKVASLFGSGQ